LDLITKRLLTTVVGLEREAEKPEERGSGRRTTISGGEKETFAALKIFWHSPLFPLVKVGW